MSDAIWADVSEHQPLVSDTYPHPVLSIRSNDGTYPDPKFAANLAWAKAATDSGRLVFFIVYLVYYPNWADGVRVLQQQVGAPHPGMVVMIDVESWPVNGAPTVSGDQSAGITSQLDNIAAWLGDARRVIVYGNKGDLNSLYPTRPPSVRLVVASYGAPPDTTFPGFIAQQYTDAEQCSPFGPCDMNTSPGLSASDLAAALGAGAPTPLIEDDDMKMIQSTGRGIAVVGPGYYRQLGSDEEVIAAGALCTGPVLIGSDHDFDLRVSICGGNVAQATLDAANNAASISSEIRNLIVDQVRGVLHEISLIPTAVGTAVGTTPSPASAPVDLVAITAAAAAGANSGASSAVKNITLTVKGV